jgi:hypothetical protein
VTTTVSRPLLLAFSVVAGLDVILGGAALAELVDPKWIGLAVLVKGGIAAGLGVWVRGQVTPWSTVSVQRTEQGLRAGPAAPGLIEVGDRVNVTPVESKP